MEYRKPASPDEARRLLDEFRQWRGRRDQLIMDALASGIGKAEIHHRTGVARSTIDRVIARHGSSHRRRTPA